MGHRNRRGRHYYIVVRRVRTPTYCVVRAIVIVLLVAAWGFCPHSGAAAQTPARRYEEIARAFRHAKPSPLPLLEVQDAWSVKLNAPPSAPGAMDREHIFIPLRDSLLVALHRETGFLDWIRPYQTSMPLLLGGPNLFLVGNREISALDAASGNHRWSTPLDAPLSAPLAWDSGWLFALTQKGELLAFRADDGTLIWRSSLGTTSPHAPVPGGANSVYLSLSDSRIVAVATSTGELQWERQLAGTLTPPTTARDRVFVGSTNNCFYAFDDKTGRDEWKWSNGGDVVGAAADGDVVYFASLDNIIRAVNRGNGNQRWRKSTGTRPLLPPLAFRGIVVQPGLMPAITVFTGIDGKAMGTHPVEGDLVGAPLIDPAAQPGQVALVTITREGVVDALRPTRLLYQEIAPVAVTALPGRALPRETLQ